MGCHTWFNNKIINMPKKDLDILKERTLSNIKQQRILKCKDYDEWAKIIREWKIDQDVKDEFLDKNFWRKRRDHVLWSKSVLEADDPNPETVISVLKEFGNLVYDNTYDLTDMGWCDNFRVYGYPEEKFYNAEDAIKFLKEYDQSKITYKKKNGYCDEIGNIITNFFNEYPNGFIEYG
jgi:hypothetical protein